MNIIWLSGEGIYPVNTGSRVVNYNRIRGLVENGNQIHLISVLDNRELANQQKNGLNEIVVSDDFYFRKEYTVSNLIKFIFYPYTVASRTSRSIVECMEKIFQEDKVDMIMCDSPSLLNNIDKIIKKHGVRCVLFLHNIEYLSMRSVAKSITKVGKKSLYLVDAFRLEQFEKRNYRKNMITSYVFLSDEDMNFFEKNLNYNNSPLFLSPIGANKHVINNERKHISHNIVIVGKMSYYPNIEGVMWFVNSVWPQVKSKIPDTKLYIVGKEPGKELINIKEQSIVVTGTVDSVEKYYRLADVIVVPIFSGGGVKTKLIEASSFKVPIVSTLSGIVGTKFEADKHVFVSDNSEIFSEKIIDILLYPEKTKSMVEKCYSLFEKEYTWEYICKRLSHFLTEI